MSMNSRHYIILLLVILFSSCGNRSERNRASENVQHSTEFVEYDEEFVEDLSSIVTIPLYTAVSNHNNNLSAIASDIEFVALSFDPPLPDPFHLWNIELSENHIFLSEMRAIYSYDRTGNFIRNIGRVGQGPEGFINISTIQLDRKNQLLYVADINRQRILVFRFDGTFERAFPIGGGRINFVMLDAQTLAWRQTISDRGRNPAPLIEFTTNNGENIKTLWSNNLPLPPSRGSRGHPDTSPLWSHNNNFYYMEFGADTIFRISENSLKPMRVLTGDLKLNFVDHFYINRGRNLRLVTPILRPNSGIFESNRFLIFRLGSDREIFFMIYDKKTREFHRTYHRNVPETPRGARRMDLFVDDMFSGLTMNPEYQSMGKAIAVLNAYEIYEQRQEILDFIENNPSERAHQLREIVQNITDDCNPVLAIITFR